MTEMSYQKNSFTCCMCWINISFSEA